jgi:Domain of unknown function (DUF1844)
MAEEKKEKAAKPRAAKKPAAEKSGPKKAAKLEEAQEVKAEDVEETIEEQEAAGSPGKESSAGSVEEEAASGAHEEEEELSDEDVQRMIEESLERVTVGDIVLNMMNQLASIGYLRMGLPENVNMKYRDFEQARLAIDILDAMIKASEGNVPQEATNAFRGTVANMQMNFVQLKARSGS